jgi:hypothetical protein
MKFWHVGILTPDIEKTLSILQPLNDGWSHAELEFLPSEMIVGSGGRLKTAMGQGSGIVYELIQPMDDISFHAAALKKEAPAFTMSPISAAMNWRLRWSPSKMPEPVSCGKRSTKKSMSIICSYRTAARLLN